MTSKQFVALAAAAALSLIVAIIVYSSSTPFTRSAPENAALFDTLRHNPPQIAQGNSGLILERKGEDWLIKEHDLFPAARDKVRAFLISLSDADLVEAKTRVADRYALLSLEDPKDKNANSRLVKLIGDSGSVIVEVIVGKQRTNAFGSGKGGTYVRKPGDEQTWLVSTEISVGTGLRDWTKPRVFETRKIDIRNLSIKAPGEENVDIKLADNGVEHLLQDIPEGKKIKFVNSIDDIAPAASSYDFDNVRPLKDTPDPAKASTITLEQNNGLKVVFTIQREDGVAWLSMAASGEGDAKKAADALNARTKGWEFQIPNSKVEAIFKRKPDLLEDIPA